jgi:hypothetical protein
MLSAAAVKRRSPTHPGNAASHAEQGGGGRPIGTPRIEIDVADEEWIPFRDVDRDRGDSLLALAWSPDAPPGW